MEERAGKNGGYATADDSARDLLSLSLELLGGQVCDVEGMSVVRTVFTVHFGTVLDSLYTAALGPDWDNFHDEYGLKKSPDGNSVRKFNIVFGKFKRIDGATMDKTRLGYARLMVKVQIGQELPDKLYFKDEKGNEISVLEHNSPSGSGKSYAKILSDKGSPDKNGGPSGMNNNVHHPGGSVWIIWAPQIFQLTFLASSAQHITVKVSEIITGDTFLNIAVYEFNDDEDRKNLWEDLRQIKDNNTLPWCICEDFNSVLNYNERIGRSVLWRKICDFRQCVDYCDVVDIQAQGSFFIWNNKQDLVTRGKDPEFKFIIRAEWAKQIYGITLFQPDDISLLQAEKDAAKIYSNLHSARFSFLEQKAKIDWLREGDANTAFYNRKIKARNTQNKVLQIKDIKGVNHTDPDSIEKAFLDYYINLLGTNKPVKKIHFPTIRAGNLITDQHVSILLRPVSPDEVKTCIFSIPPNKSSGPDGYCSQFFNDSWAIIGMDICEAVCNFFQTGKLLKQINVTNITLIPKFSNPTSVMKFRPIACCNIIYKCIAKILCTRLVAVLPDLEGGLSIKASKIWNKTLLGKYVWWLTSKKDHLWVKWVNHVHMKGKDWTFYDPPSDCSWSWKKIAPTMKIFAPGYTSNKWLGEDKGYKVKDGYSWLRPGLSPVPWRYACWNYLNVPETSFIYWVVMHKRLLTKDILTRMGMVLDASCFLCGMVDESHDHLFFYCCFSRQCVYLLQHKLRVSFSARELSDWLKMRHVRNKMQRKLICALHVGLVYAIWRTRNKARLDHHVLLPGVLVKRVVKDGLGRFWARNSGRLSRGDLEWLAYIAL
ncbi:uncharacterized protein LOC141586748 [Silene latifolia]|uniref:uncharacterized protein LOC141586748 n=1 Tax=Silene latifolia TaxID=37657 RepID=UPI003D76C583